MAEELKNKSYLLSFNLFTELRVDQCRADNRPCNESLRKNPGKYNEWTSEVVRVIRETGGKNAERILILASPGKLASGLSDINKTIHENDPYMMVEWHTYAAGPHKKVDGPRYWSGNGTTIGRFNVREAIKPAKEFTNETGLLSYFGAWMPQDNIKGELIMSETEVINFARFFVQELKMEQIPWSLNVLDVYYNTRKSKWITATQTIPSNSGASLNMSRVLDNILEVM